MTLGKLLGIVFILAGIVVLNTKAEAEHDLQDAKKRKSVDNGKTTFSK